MKTTAKKAVKPTVGTMADLTPASLRHLAHQLEVIAMRLEEDAVNEYIRAALNLPG